MKKLVYLIGISLIVSSNLFAQEASDALRYSQNTVDGTARFTSMGGAFGALGGDMSSISYNPAGLGVYRKSEFSFSPSLNYSLDKSDYLGEKYSDFSYKMNVGNFGFVGSFTSENEEEGWVGLNFGFSYNKMNNFNRNTLIQGTNSENSMTDFFALKANGKTSETMDYFSEGLAWDSYLINQKSGELSQYESVMNTYGELQQKAIQTKGSVGEYNISMGANYGHKFYIGGSVGFQSINFEENSIYTEEDLNNEIDSFAKFDFTQNLQTEGSGINLKIGTIFRPIEWMRVGIAFHSPTFYSLNDNYVGKISADFDSGVSHEKESQIGVFDYELSTPLKAIGSLAFVMKEKALLSVDYEFVDYTSMRMRSDSYTFINENTDIQNNFVATGNIRAGLEYKFGPYSLRGGYTYYGNPYNKNNVNNKKQNSSYSLGFGVKDEGFFFDLAYVLSMSKENYFLYDIAEPSSITTIKHKVVATFGFKF